jgi:hypothetical protein
MAGLGLFCLSFVFAARENFSLPIFPPPRQVEVLGSSWQLQLPIRVEAPETLQRPAELLRKELCSLFGENAVSDQHQKEAGHGLPSGRQNRKDCL